MSLFVTGNNIINQIDNFFTEVFKGFRDIVSWQTLGILLAGIIVGFVICSTIYGILMLQSVNKKEKEIKNLNEDEIDENIKTIIQDIKQDYISSSEGLAIKDRFDILGQKILETVNQIAGTYYPNSKYPIYELTVEELLMLIRYLTSRIESIFDKPILKLFKKMSIAQVFKLLDAKKKIDDNKAVKALKKANAGKITSILMTAGKILNPVTWFKKLVVNSTVNFAISKMTIIIIDIVANETNKVYSKKIFNKEKELQYLEIEKALAQLEREELDA